MALPVISVEQMRRWEAATWESGKTEEEVIARVGEVVAARASELTQPGDAILLLAGKGHETVQIQGGHAEPFDDAIEAQAALARWESEHA